MLATLTEGCAVLVVCDEFDLKDRPGAAALIIRRSLKSLPRPERQVWHATRVRCPTKSPLFDASHESRRLGERWVSEKNPYWQVSASLTVSCVHCQEGPRYVLIEN